MIPLDTLLIDEAVFSTTFACDLKRCKGACCTLEGGGGAPLADVEVSMLRAAIPAALPYLPERSRQWLAQHDPVEGGPGSWSVACIDDRDCVFVTYDGDIAKCGIEMAWRAEATPFRKPISCHLFPIRVADFGGPYLHYERFDECEPGRELGASLGQPLVVSLAEALTRAYGAERYQEMLDVARDGASS